LGRHDLHQVIIPGSKPETEQRARALLFFYSRRFPLLPIHWFLQYPLALTNPTLHFIFTLRQSAIFHHPATYGNAFTFNAIA
jgi:hypothetical protein